MEIDGYSIKKIKDGNIKLIHIETMMIMNFLLGNILKMLRKVGRIMKEKELNFTFFLNGLVIFGNVTTANINKEISKILSRKKWKIIML